MSTRIPLHCQSRFLAQAHHKIHLNIYIIDVNHPCPNLYLKLPEGELLWRTERGAAFANSLSCYSWMRWYCYCAYHRGTDREGGGPHYFYRPSHTSTRRGRGTTLFQHKMFIHLNCFMAQYINTSIEYKFTDHYWWGEDETPSFKLIS